MIIKAIAVTGGALAGLIALSYVGTTQTCFDTAAANQASLEDEPLALALADPQVAMTFAVVQVRDAAPMPILVTSFSEDEVNGISLLGMGAPPGSSVFEAYKILGRQALLDEFARGQEIRAYKKKDLLPSGGNSDRHVASGTNFPEHAEETDSNSVFHFPKFGVATRSVTKFERPSGSLLDYEVEICVRFDTSVRTAEDFDAALKGFFLCADFSDRATLTRLIDPDNFDSGSGFSDAKSGPGFFPTGPFLVIPTDWREFVDEERMTTHVNGEIRQDARGGEMTLDFRELVEKALSETSARFIYQKQKHKLLPEHYISEGTVVMSGTSEGVIFTPPTRCDISAGVFGYTLGGGFLTESDARSSVIETFIDREMSTRHYLQPGDFVNYRSSRLGTIEIEIVEGDADLGS